MDSEHPVYCLNIAPAKPLVLRPTRETNYLSSLNKADVKGSKMTLFLSSKPKKVRNVLVTPSQVLLVPVQLVMATLCCESNRNFQLHVFRVTFSTNHSLPQLQVISSRYPNEGTPCANCDSNIRSIFTYYLVQYWGLP